jgi:hypothetical protein
VRWFVRWGVWIVLGLAVLAWEVIAVKAVRKTLGMPPRDHVTISEIVWRFERRFGRWGQLVVGVAMLDLALHFLFGTPLAPLP